MSYTRRDLLKQGTAFAAISTLPRPLFALLDGPPELVPPIEDPRLKQLTSASLDAARTAGAEYADARLTHDYLLNYTGYMQMQESMNFGVRVLVEGYWGFAASPVWSVEEAARLGRAAVRQAKANVLGKPRVVDLAPVASIQEGHWTTPIKDDPFLMSRDELSDFILALAAFIAKNGVTTMAPFMEFLKQDKAFASTSGQYCTQRLYRTQAGVPFQATWGDQKLASGLLVTPASAGFEYLRDQPLREWALQLIEEANEDVRIPLKPVDVGKYTIVFDANTTADLISQTIGTATELDRALGFEANAGGTSYINEPLEMVGTLKVGGPALTVTANRSEPTGAATVKWDDEGVQPRNVTLVDKGILANMQTNREGAGWLKGGPDNQKPIESCGCAYAPNAQLPPLTHCANLQMQSSGTTATFASLIKDVPKGIAIKRGQTDMDFQQVTGLTMGMAYEIKNGQRVAWLIGAGITFRTQELWNGITALGGPGSAQRFGLQAAKGQPRQEAYRSVTAGPATFKDLTVIDLSRKA